MAITSSNRTAATASATETIVKRDVHKDLWHLGEPSAFPLISLMGGTKYENSATRPTEVASRIKIETAGTNKHEVIEKDQLARTGTTSAAVADTTTTTVVFTSNANFRPGDIIKNKSTGEKLYVVAVDAGGANITARRNLGSTSFQIGSGDIFGILGCAYREGTAKAEQRSQIAAPRTRYLQIFKRAFGITGTLENTELEVNIDAWDEERFQAAYNHKLDIENCAWGNPAADSTTDATGTVYLSRGILDELGADRTSSYDGSLDEGWFFGTFAQETFKYGNRRKTLFVNAEAMTQITGFARVKQQLKPMDSKYGLKITELETGHGIFDVTMCGTFTNVMPEETTPYAVALDLDYLRYRHLKNRNMMMDEGIETPGTDAKEGQFLTECGFMVYSLQNHRIMRKNTVV